MSHKGAGAAGKAGEGMGREWMGMRGGEEGGEEGRDDGGEEGRRGGDEGREGGGPVCGWG